MAACGVGVAFAGVAVGLGADVERLDLAVAAGLTMLTMVSVAEFTLPFEYSMIRKKVASGYLLRTWAMKFTYAVMYGVPGSPLVEKSLLVRLMVTAWG